jgi:hypothetical protein
MQSMTPLFSTWTSYKKTIYDFYFVGDKLIMIMHIKAHYQYVKENDGVADHN